jgi:hypothetical protein
VQRKRRRRCGYLRRDRHLYARDNYHDILDNDDLPSEHNDAAPSNYNQHSNGGARGCRGGYA